jgi:hypothetical protein
MKNLAFAFLFVVPCLSLADEPKSGLKEFTSKEGRFSILFPDSPKEERVPDKQGRLLQIQFAVGNKDGAYIVSYQDNPTLAKAAKEEVAKALLSAQEAARSAVNGKVVQAKEITLGKDYTGREYEFEMPVATGGVFRSRAYMVKDRLYQLIAVGTKDFAKSKEASRFFDSFKLTE